MKLKTCTFNHPIYTPNGGGGTSAHVREPQYRIDLEGAMILVRSRAVSNGQIVKVPMANVSCFEEQPEDAPGKVADMKPPSPK